MGNYIKNVSFKLISVEAAAQISTRIIPFDRTLTLVFRGDLKGTLPCYLGLYVNTGKQSSDRNWRFGLTEYLG